MHLEDGEYMENNSKMGIIGIAINIVTVILCCGILAFAC